MGQHERALDLFQRALRFREAQGQPGPIRIARLERGTLLCARWAVLDEALVMQRALAG